MLKILLFFFSFFFLVSCNNNIIDDTSDNEIIENDDNLNDLENNDLRFELLVDNIADTNYVLIGEVVNINVLSKNQITGLVINNNYYNLVNNCVDYKLNKVGLNTINITSYVYNDNYYSINEIYEYEVIDLTDFKLNNPIYTINVDSLIIDASNYDLNIPIYVSVNTNYENIVYDDLLKSNLKIELTNIPTILNVSYYLKLNSGSLYQIKSDSLSGINPINVDLIYVDDFTYNCYVTANFSDIEVVSYEINGEEYFVNSANFTISKPKGSILEYMVKINFKYKNKSYFSESNISFTNNNPQNLDVFIDTSYEDELLFGFNCQSDNVTKYEVLIYEGDKLVDTLSSFWGTLSFKNYMYDTDYRFVYRVYYKDIFTLEEKCLETSGNYHTGVPTTQESPISYYYDTYNNIININPNYSYDLINVEIYLANELIISECSNIFKNLKPGYYTIKVKYKNNELSHYQPFEGIDVYYLNIPEEDAKLEFIYESTPIGISYEFKNVVEGSTVTNFYFVITDNYLTYRYESSDLKGIIKGLNPGQYYNVTYYYNVYSTSVTIEEYIQFKTEEEPDVICDYYLENNILTVSGASNITKIAVLWHLGVVIEQTEGNSITCDVSGYNYVEIKIEYTYTYYDELYTFEKTIYVV